MFICWFMAKYAYTLILLPWWRGEEEEEEKEEGREEKEIREDFEETYDQGNYLNIY